MNVDQLLNMMEDLLEGGVSIPLSGGKHMVDVDKAQDLIDEVRANLPDEIRQAKEVVNDRAQILGEAKREAEGIIKRAEDRARAMVNEQEILKEAKRQAAEMLALAQSQTREMRTSVAGYCDEMLRTSEEALSQSAADVKATRANLRQMGKK